MPAKVGFILFKTEKKCAGDGEMVSFQRDQPRPMILDYADGGVGGAKIQAAEDFGHVLFSPCVLMLSELLYRKQRKMQGFYIFFVMQVRLKR